MGEFSAHRVTVSAGERVVIATKQNLYVSPFGDDERNSGIEEGSPFKTPQRAVDWFADKYISESGFVTVNFAPGIYNLTDEISFDYDQGTRVAFVGAEPEILLLQYVSDYVTSGFTAAGYGKFYSGVTHGITLSCVRPSDNTVYTAITGSNPIITSCTVPGCGVVIEDFELAHIDNYNPAYYYGSYPYNTKNNITRQSSILGSHILSGVSANTGLISIQSSIRDDWFSIPQGNSASWGRMFGNVQAGVCYYSGFCGNNPADFSETQTNAWFERANLSGSASFRSHYISSVPVGYYGTNATTGVTIGSTANLLGLTFPSSSTAGGTATYLYKDISNIGRTGWYTATGPAGSFLNDAYLFGNNYHEHTAVNGRDGIGSSGSWRSVNSNRITVKIIPTVFRRFGNHLKIGAGGLRKIKNIFFDGVNMPCHWKLLGNNETGYSNKYAIYAVNSKLGEVVINEPEGLGVGLLSNVGVKDFHVGFYADRGTDAYLGKLVASNCSYGLLANNRSSINTVGSVCTGMGSVGFGAFTSSSIVADRCFASFVGQSLVTIRIKQVPAGTTLNDSSYIQGQTFASPDGKIKGTVWDWDPRDKTLVIAVRAGMFEAADAITQG